MVATDYSVEVAQTLGSLTAASPLVVGSLDCGEVNCSQAIVTHSLEEVTEADSARAPMAHPAGIAASLPDIGDGVPIDKRGTVANPEPVSRVAQEARLVRSRMELGLAQKKVVEQEELVNTD